MEQNPSEQVENLNLHDGDDKQGIYDCPFENCRASFMKYGNLLRHVLIGKCRLAPLRQTLRDHALNTFRSRLEDIEVSQTDVKLLDDALKELKYSTTEDAAVLKRGWALRERKERTHITANVHYYLRQIFNDGAEHREKRANPMTVAKQMKSAMQINGVGKRFSANEYLTPQQIAAVFSQLNRRRIVNALSGTTNTAAPAGTVVLDEDLVITTEEEDHSFTDEPIFDSEFDEVHASITDKEARQQIFAPN
jgi:hypothetical protein